MTDETDIMFPLPTYVRIAGTGLVVKAGREREFLIWLNERSSDILSMLTDDFREKLAEKRAR